MPGSMFPEEITTIKEQSEFKFKEKGSLFIGLPSPVKNLQDIEHHLSASRKKYFDATHHCFAYRLLDSSVKYSDQGEPAGSAGIRILNAIDHFHLTNVLLIVTRYFGGTKLGVGPLGKAYYRSAEHTLLNSTIIKQTVYKKIEIYTDFETLNHIHRILSDTGSKILQTRYEESVIFECLVKPGMIEKLKSDISGYMKGKGQLNIFDDYYLI